MGSCKDICVGFSKCILFVLNLLILIFAIIMVTRAAILKSTTAGLDVKDVSSFAIALGVIMGLIAFAGCWGAIRENSCCLTIYAGVLLTLFFIQVILGILAFVGAGQDSEIQKEVLDHLSDLYKQRNVTENFDTINSIQQSLHCCGLEGPNGTDVALNSTVIMKSCCNETVATCTPTLGYKISCTKELSDIIMGSLVITGVIAVFFALLELACAVFAFCVRGSIRREGELLP